MITISVVGWALVPRWTSLVLGITKVPEFLFCRVSRLSRITFIPAVSGRTGGGVASDPVSIGRDEVGRTAGPCLLTTSTIAAASAVRRCDLIFLQEDGEEEATASFATLAASGHQMKKARTTGDLAFNFADENDIAARGTLTLGIFTIRTWSTRFCVSIGVGICLIRCAA